VFLSVKSEFPLRLRDDSISALLTGVSREDLTRLWSEFLSERSTLCSERDEVPRLSLSRSPPPPLRCAFAFGSTVVINARVIIAAMVLNFIVFMAQTLNCF
jgi:hypothetical protein